MTTMPKAQEISRKWYIIDAAEPSSRPDRCCQAAAILRGKHKVDFCTPCGLRRPCNHHQLPRRQSSPARRLEQKFYPPSLWLGRRSQGDSLRPA